MRRALPLRPLFVSNGMLRGDLHLYLLETVRGRRQTFLLSKIEPSPLASCSVCTGGSVPGREVDHTTSIWRQGYWCVEPYPCSPYMPSWRGQGQLWICSFISISSRQTPCQSLPIQHSSVIPLSWRIHSERNRRTCVRSPHLQGLKRCLVCPQQQWLLIQHPASSRLLLAHDSGKWLPQFDGNCLCIWQKRARASLFKSSATLSAGLSLLVHLPVLQSVHPYGCPSIIRPPIYLSICLSIYLSIYLSIFYMGASRTAHLILHYWRDRTKLREW